jgi:hypothetical protein
MEAATIFGGKAKGAFGSVFPFSRVDEASSHLSIRLPIVRRLWETDSRSWIPHQKLSRISGVLLG